QVYDYVRQCGEGVWEVNLFSKRQQFLVRRLGGEVRVFAPWSAERSTAIQVEVLPGVGGGEWEVELRAFESTAPISWGECVSFDAVVREVEREFEEWLRRSPVVLEEYAGGRELAAYVQWAALVGPCDRLKREGMLMSKNWMVNVWSWDHCFNAIALAAGQSELAWEQWALPFDYQNRWGALPDCVNDYDVVWNFTKPPVHGWALREMIARGVELGKEQVKQAAEWLELWTEWWLRYRDDDGDGLPQYNHGNDSGWDNATLFAHGMPVEGPDLAAYLVVQMEVVADLWDRLGKGERAEGWRERAKGLVGRLLEHSVRGGGFVAPRAGDHAVAEEGDCLLRFLPLLLGARLPEGLRRNLVQGVMEAGRFLTEYGLATESPRSRLYVADGYWRGPIWAPSTLLLVSGLRACGERELAEEVGRRFCRMVVRSGCAENFDALTG
ncbi:MAG: hypothetical protein NZL93_05775, partial [Chthoniobacterales bacterium]|nr:hypothetical protein [Chthoniobacterales bacterium]